MDINPIIVVAAYRRPKSLARLLNSLAVASYPPEGVNVVVSLDGGFSEAVLAEAERFKASFSGGQVDVIVRCKNIGLRQHILWCGDQVERTGSVILLEEDIYVDPQFYRYAVSALMHYKGDQHVSGVALYSPEYNEYAGLPFKPLCGSSCTYHMQIPCSWGQAWDRDQWGSFRSWLAGQNAATVDGLAALPDAVKKWPESSWKKYFSAYLLVKNRYFVYPYRSYSTNAGDPGGVHVKNGTTVYQVALAHPQRGPDEYAFQDIASDDAIVYDAHMEPASSFLYDLIGCSADDVEIDFYGVKPVSLILKKRYCLTTRNVASSLRSFGLSFRPFEHSLLRGEDSESAAKVYFADSNALLRNVSNVNRVGLLTYLGGVNLLSTKLVVPLAYAVFCKLINRMKS